MTKREYQAADYAAELNENDNWHDALTAFFPEINLPEKVANTVAIHRQCLVAAGLEIDKLRREVETLKQNR